MSINGLRLSRRDAPRRHRDPGIGTAEDQHEGPGAKSSLVAHVVMPALAQAEVAFSSALGRITIEDLMHTAQQQMQKSVA